jgi:hypothetical protein
MREPGASASVFTTRSATGATSSAQAGSVVASSCVSGGRSRQTPCRVSKKSEALKECLSSRSSR